MAQTREQHTEYMKNKRAKDKVWGKPTILSDGQLWWPGHMGLHPPGCECGINHVGEWCG